MDDDMDMNSNENEPKLLDTIKPMKSNKKVKLSKHEIRQKVNENVINKINELRKVRNEQKKKVNLKDFKLLSNTADLSWFTTPFNELYSDTNINTNNFERLTKLRTNFTHEFARFDDGELKQEYYNENIRASYFVWSDLELMLLYKGMKKCGIFNINCWKKISEYYVPTRNFMEIKLKICRLMGIQNLNKYKDINSEIINEIYIKNEFERNKNIGIKKGLWVNNIYINDESLLNDNNILNKNYINKKKKNFENNIKGKIEWISNSFEDYDGNVYYFKSINEFIDKKYLYGYDLKTFDLDSSDDNQNNNENIINNDNESEYSESMSDFNENDYEIISDNLMVNDDEKDESAVLVVEQ